jgi:hypothetical protein
MKRPTVIIRHCPEYDTPFIRGLIREGLEHLDLRPHGRTLVKPNVVASGQHFPHAYTRPEFVEGVLHALRDRARHDLVELAVGERCGITMPTRFAFRGAGYYPMFERVGDVVAYHFDEVSQVEIPLYHEGRLRDSFYTPEPVAKADFFVNCPKFKAHPWTTVTFSMKNYIGIQDDRHRLIDHDHRLNREGGRLAVHHPAAVHRDRRDHRRRRADADAGPVRSGARDHGRQPGRVRRGVLPHHRRRSAERWITSGMAYERGFGPVEPWMRSISRGDVTLAEAKQPRRRAFGWGSSGSRTTSRAPTSRRSRGPAAERWRP